jgi:anti-sigma regulatory factor (Ser/Thr protein kinase)
VPELETAIYRVIQETLTNATKHGHAKRVVIEVFETLMTVELIVRDDWITPTCQRPTRARCKNPLSLEGEPAAHHANCPMTVGNDPG